MASLISIWTEPLPPEYQWTPDDYVGGTPEYAVETAECLTRLGFQVIVYYDGPGTTRGSVVYLPRELYQPGDIVLDCNSTAPLRSTRPRKRIYWTSLVTDREHMHTDYDERIVISNYHQSLYGSNSKVIYLACWPEKFMSSAKMEKSCLYSSSPDRGGDFLKRIWPDVEAATGAQLTTTYSNKLSEEEMEKLYQRTRFWLHPCQGVELFCISGYKAQVAGCIPVYVPNMALAETVRFGVKTTLHSFKDDLIAALNNPPAVPELEYWDWLDVTKQLVELFA